MVEHAAVRRGRGPGILRPQEPNLQPDDLIVYVDGEKITSIQEFHTLIDHAKPGSTVKLEIRRGDKLFNIDIKLDPLPPRRKP